MCHLRFQRRAFALFFVWLTGLSFHASAADASWKKLEYAPAPADNPLKGLVPYSGDRRGQFPHSMEFNYLPLSSLMTGYDEYNWKPLENLLNEAAARGHQTVFRVFLEFPGRKEGIPAFLIKDGLKTEKYLDTNVPPHPPMEVETPDYADANLRKALRQFIAALGRKYDGDPRIGFITAGLLGSWGEWHDYPRDDLFASKEVQAEVMDAYEAAFKKTRVLLRYPAGDDNKAKAANAKRPFGYHDDSFAWSTLPLGQRDGWFFMPAMTKAGPEALEKWKRFPIGGEIRPEAWGKVFDAEPGVKEIQNFHACVDSTHATWLMDSGMFRRDPPAERVRRAQAEVRHMGYEFHVRAVKIEALAGGKLRVQAELENCGVAPFYYDWPMEWGFIASDRSVAATFPGSGKLTGLLPGDAARTWDDTLDMKKVGAGKYRLALRVPNPLPKGSAVRFANRTQDADAEGWLTLEEWTKDPPKNTP